jgi:hypothetical protein
MISLMADHPTGSGHSGRRSSVKAGLTPNRPRRTVQNDECSHLNPPYKAEPARLAELLIDCWTHGLPGREGGSSRSPGRRPQP